MIQGANFASYKMVRNKFEVNSCVPGFHVYTAVWAPQIRKNLCCAHESGNGED